MSSMIRDKKDVELGKDIPSIKKQLGRPVTCFGCGKIIENLEDIRWGRVVIEMGNLRFRYLAPFCSDKCVVTYEL